MYQGRGCAIYSTVGGGGSESAVSGAEDIRQGGAGEADNTDSWKSGEIADVDTHKRGKGKNFPIKLLTKLLKNSIIIKKLVNNNLSA